MYYSSCMCSRYSWTVLCWLTCIIDTRKLHTTVEYLNKNISVGQLLQYIPNSIVVCAGSNKNIQQRSLSGFITNAFN